MTPGSYDFKVKKGDRLPFLFRLKDGSGNPLALGTDRLDFIIGWPTGAITKSTSDGTLAVNYGTSVISDELTPTQTSRLPNGRVAKFKLRRIYASGEGDTYLEGYLIAESA